LTALTTPWQDVNGLPKEISTVPQAHKKYHDREAAQLGIDRTHRSASAKPSTGEYALEATKDVIEIAKEILEDTGITVVPGVLHVLKLALALIQTCQV